MYNEESIIIIVDST